MFKRNYHTLTESDGYAGYPMMHGLDENFNDIYSIKRKRLFGGLAKGSKLRKSRNYLDKNGGDKLVILKRVPVFVKKGWLPFSFTEKRGGAGKDHYHGIKPNMFQNMK